MADKEMDAGKGEKKESEITHFATFGMMVPWKL